MTAPVEPMTGRPGPLLLLLSRSARQERGKPRQERGKQSKSAAQPSLGEHILQPKFVLEIPL